MMPEEIAKFERVRVQARAYLCLLLNRSIPNYLPNPDIKVIIDGIKLLKKESIKIEALYVLDAKGEQVSQNISDDPMVREARPGNHSARAYYHRAAREKKCVITSPYPSTLTNDLSVTASYPVYDNQIKLHYIVCMDISLRDLLKFAQHSGLDTMFGYVTKISYGLFSVALSMVAFMLFYNGVSSLLTHGINIDKIEIKQMFESTILLTLSLAIFDLVRAIFEEEVLGSHKKHDESDIHKTMVRFLGSIIIALSIESLMLVFKFAITDPDKLVYAIYIIGGVSLLLISLATYIKFTKNNNTRESE